LRRLASLIDPPFDLEIKKRVSVAIRKSEFAREWRDRHIAHRDLHLALGESPKPLPAVSRKRIKDAIEAITAVLNAIDGHYCKANTGYEFSAVLGNAETLLRALEEVRRARLEPWTAAP
jgi:hypothetical protein